MEKIIVTFTSYPERIWTVNKVLDSIIKQTILPYKIILYLSSTEFLNFGSIPDFEQYKKYGFESVGDHFIEAEREHVTMVHEPLNDIYDK